MKVERPYIICHMAMSLDGKVTGEFLNHPEAIVYEDEYYRIHKEMNADAFLCGRVTMEGSFTHGYVPNLSKYQNEVVKREDFVAKKASFYAVAIDSKGKLGWKDCCIHDDDPGYDQAHIIEVVSENVSDAYLSYLKDKGISYIFGGKEVIDLHLVCQKLKELFSIETLLLEGGAIVNGSFLKENLIDELSLVMIPLTESHQQSKSLFESTSSHVTSFELIENKIIGNHGCYFRFKKYKSSFKT